MGIVSTTILSLLVICSFSWRAEAFPVGCNKLTGTMEDAIPEEYIVKMKKGTLKEHIVKLMFEMTNSGCEGKITTTSSASKAVKGPIACSNMIYIAGIGFAAKMSDAAVMWLCNKDSVDYIEPSYVITLPTTPPTTVTPVTEESGSGTPVTTDDGVITPITTVTSPASTTDGTTEPDNSETTKSPSCNKIQTHSDDTAIVEGQYIVLMKKIMTKTDLIVFIELIKSLSTYPNNIMKVRNLQPAMELNMFVADLDKAALQWLCNKDMVDYIEPSYVITLPTTQPTTVTSRIPVTEDDGSGTPVTTDNGVIIPITTGGITKPKTTTTVTPVTTDPPTTTTTTTTSAPVTTDVTPPVKCNKMRGGSLLKTNDYLVMFQYELPEIRVEEIYILLKSIQTLDSTFSWSKIKGFFDIKIKGFYYDGLSELAAMMLCESDVVDYIEVKPPPCDKIQKYSDNSGIIQGRYTVSMKKDMTITEVSLFIDLIEKHSSNPNNLMKVKDLHRATGLKKFIADLDEVALRWICKNPQVDYIDPMKKPFPLPDNNLGQRCTNVKGTMKDSNQCRIYVKNGCQHFVDRLKMTTNSPNFSIKRISHRKPPMIIAYMKADTVHEVCKSSCVKEIVCK